MNLTLRLLLTFLWVQLIWAQPSPDVRLNQIGFYTNGPKIAAVINSTAQNFKIKSTDLSTEYFSGTLSSSSNWAASGESVKTADFSSFHKEGSYVLEVEGFGYSFPFEIRDNILTSLNKSLIKAYYYNRGSTALESQYAGIWARPSSHPDTEVIVHAAAASTLRPAGTIISSPKGWYDAGDYNSYIVNSGITTYTLMTSYEHFKSYYDTLSLNIPESNNQLPDILDEIKWNLDWMLTMQDPNDGGVYNKKTNANFDGFVMPDKAVQPRYVVQKSTGSACNLAAVLAVAYRIYLPYDPTFAASCLDAAKKAYDWALENPNVTFSNPPATGVFPEVRTGGYGDGNLTDELEWAGNELYISTKNDSYYKYNTSQTFGVPTWNSVRTLGLISLVYNRKNLTSRGYQDTSSVKSKLLGLATRFRDYQLNTSPYKIVMGEGGNSEFFWGSNSQAANQGMILLNAYILTKDKSFANAALSQVDYIMGRNALNYSYVTGFGSKRVMNVHHRPSGADGIIDPIPGWVVGGPANATGDGCENNSRHPAKSFEDGQDCYTKSEIAINWNAPVVYITGAYEFLKIYNLVNGVQNESSMDVNSKLHVFPIPASNILNIELESQYPSEGLLNVTDLSGMSVSKTKVGLNAGNNSFMLNIDNYTSGIYILNIETKYQKLTQKIIITGY